MSFAPDDDSSEYEKEEQQKHADFNEQMQQATVRLLIYFFRMFTEKEQIDESEWYQIQSYTLLGWIRNNLPTLDMNKAAVEAKVDNPEFMSQFNMLLYSQAAPSVLSTVWPRVLFANRKPPTVPILGVTLALHINFADNTVVPLSTSATRSLHSREIFDDSMLCTLMIRAVEDVMQMLYQRSIEELRVANSVSTGGARGYAEFSRFVATQMQLVPEPTRSFIRSWLKLTELLSSTALPLHVQQALQQQVDSFTQHAQNTPKPEGYDKETTEILPADIPPQAPESGWNIDTE